MLIARLGAELADRPGLSDIEVTEVTQREAKPACVQWFFNAPTKLLLPTKGKRYPPAAAQAKQMDSHFVPGSPAMQKLGGQHQAGVYNCCYVIRVHWGLLSKSTCLSEGYQEVKSRSLKTFDSPASVPRSEDEIEEPMSISSFLAAAARSTEGPTKTVSLFFDVHASLPEVPLRQLRDYPIEKKSKPRQARESFIGAGSS